MTTRQRARLAIPITLACLVPPAAATADDAEDRREAALFEAEIRPVLTTQCAKCHGEAKQKGGLRVDSRDALMAGGDSGPALVPGKPDESLIVAALRHEGPEMPPDGKLDDRTVDAFTRWVEHGAAWPGSGTAPAGPRSKLTDEDRAWWSFQPTRRVEPPSAGADWARNPIDAFVYDRLAREGLAPAPEADRRTLIRRLTFDLTGLPPTPEVVEAFAADPDPNVYERLVDRLLARPSYGQRMARDWLDLVRYAESDGYRQDAYRPDAWRYRDWVVDAINRDLPYDRFLAEQIAADEIAPADPSAQAALGFLRLGAYEFNQRDAVAQRAAILNDLTDVLGDAVLGLGLACARCHDHKFDPILQADYYRFQAFFTPLANREVPLPDPDAPPAWAGLDERRAAWEVATTATRAAIEEMDGPKRSAAERDAIAKFPAPIQAILAKADADRTPAERLLGELAYRQVAYEFDHLDAKFQGDAKKQREALVADLKRFDPLKPPTVATAPSATDVGRESPPTLIPGDRRARPIAPGFLTLLDPADAPIEPPTRIATTGRRSALARWLADPANPLVARVMVNRLWQHHFGRGIVATPSDFGRLGEMPSHPELLDWLATEAVARGWSVKAMHRLIVTSATYRQASGLLARESSASAEAADPVTIDPEGRLLWRQSPRRLEAEALRDAMLAVSGELRPTFGGPPVEPKDPRRSIDTKVRRNSRDPLLGAFDAPDGALSVARRDETTTPTQALLLINGPWALARSQTFAARLEREAPGDRARQVDRAYRLAFGRPPTDSERADALGFLSEHADPPATLGDFAHVLLNANEFLYLD